MPPPVFCPSRGTASDLTDTRFGDRREDAETAICAVRAVSVASGLPPLPSEMTDR